MPQSNAPEQPNLVFILPDRQRRDSMACYDNDWIQAPRLNALADESFVVEHCYVTQPVCAPARSSILSGLYPLTAGMPVNRLVMPDPIQSIAQMVPDEYRCGYVGKWHLGDEIFPQRGFGEWVGANDNWWTEYTDATTQTQLSPYHHFLMEHGVKPDTKHPGGKMVSGPQRHALPAELMMASFVGDQAADFIERSADRPFVLFASTVEPHPPFTGPYDDLYDPATMPVEETFLRHPDGAAQFNQLRAELFSRSVRDGIDLSTEDGWRRLRANYWGLVTLVDRMVGTILDALERTGVADNTVVVFTSDHGDMVGTHRMLEMRTPYEEATRVPLLMRVPWLSDKATTVPGNFSQIDFVPTLLDLLGQPVPAHVQGVSRAGVLRGEETLAGNDVFVQHNGEGDRDLTDECDSYDWPQEKVDELNRLNTLPWRSVVTADRWKLSLYQADQGELFDLNRDPLETTNLFDDPAHRQKARDLAQKIYQWQAAIRDTVRLPQA
ncbi:MAG: sulfatase-like hydrolase/transferase [Candidatus Latescibacteria bacterium]|nr:sulfatase-like hydrolase/transferase [Candidatus Latescibacterota bacterium]